jgi:hypothetical protein
MSKRKKTNSHKTNKQKPIMKIIREKFKNNLNNLDYINIIISVISIIISLCVAKQANHISNTVNNFNYKMAQLNLAIENYNTPDIMKIENNNQAFTLSPYKIYPTVNKFSGSYSEVIFSYVKNSVVDMVSYETNKITSESIILNDEIPLIVTGFNNKELIFYLSSPSLESFDLIHIIFKGYNNEFYIYTMIFSTKSYMAYFLDNVDVNNKTLLNKIIHQFELKITSQSLQETIKKQRKDISESLTY